MEADIFVNDNWMPFPSKKYANDNEYIEAFQKFLKTGILPIFIFFFLLFSCEKQKQSIPSKETKKENVSLCKDSTKLSDSLKLSLERIKIMDDGKGSDDEVINNFLIEEESWKKEIDLIYNKLHKKISKTDKETIPSLEKYHSEWENYTKQKYTFRRNYLDHHIFTKQWIFYVFPEMRKEYKNKLIEYYELYEFDKE